MKKMDSKSHIKPHKMKIISYSLTIEPQID